MRSLSTVDPFRHPKDPSDCRRQGCPACTCEARTVKLCSEKLFSAVETCRLLAPARHTKSGSTSRDHKAARAGRFGRDSIWSAPMGASSKFHFALPGRKNKQHAAASPVLPQISEPLTKAQRILGTTAVSIDLIGTPVESSSQWDAPAPYQHSGDSRSGSAHRDGRWEDESDIIPRGMDRRGDRPHDVTTDASSLRRRQSTSTITSFYDKEKLPLSISQQTSNSSMAKGLPSKAQALLDIDGNFNTEPKGLKKKKPSRLDLSSLLPRHRSRQQLRPEPEKANVPGHDRLTKSPSLMSISPAPTPPPIQQRIDKSLRNKMTRESLRDMVRKSEPAAATSSAGRMEAVKHLPVKSSVELHNLYDHYEQRTFDDAMDHELRGSLDSLDPPHNQAAAPPYPTPPASNTGKAYLSPFPPSVSRTAAVQVTKKPPLALTPVQLQLASASSPVSADCASVSSRHTRTSKASKRTDHSLNDIDLLQNSVLALSSDSEEDDYDAGADQLSVPPLSDGPASPVSPRSAMSQPKSDSTDSRNRQAKQATFAANPHYIPPPGPPPTKALPKISVRTTSLSPNSLPKASPALSQASQMSRTPTSDTKVISMIPKKPSTDKFSARTAAEATEFEDFPAPPIRPAQRPPSAAQNRLESDLSPTSVDFYLHSQRSSVENGSLRSNNSRRSSEKGGRRDSAHSSIHEDGGSGRFMAVTRQEEMLLAALRQKRARMREDLLAEFEEGTEREEQLQLRREPTNDTSCGTSMISRQSTMNSIRPEMGALSARPRHQTSLRGLNPARLAEKLAEHQKPTPVEADEGLLITLDDFPSPMNTDFIERRPSSKTASRSSSLKQRNSSAAATPQRPPRSGSVPRRASEQVSPRSSSNLNNSSSSNALPQRIMEDPAEDDQEGIPRPDSPISPSDFPVPAASLSNKIINKKQVRLSAVGYFKPNVEAEWWDDSG
ncbi:hypothetical protein QBC42DRAFT_342703 [Cladorrhinum samala]|uniref:Uncharacterized protein n=1 Tax=Cladorrhinum samala TaxID=585594 RepID=A0AAV9I1B6_9PEZI|nr:hypothetical protein QBC42DRAFT_342703 [Cladorrhinum samala]